MRSFLIIFICLTGSLSTLSGQIQNSIHHFLAGSSSVTPGLPVYLSNSSGLVKDHGNGLYLNDDWMEATIYVNDTLTVDVNARYNIMLDRMEYLAGVDTIRQVYPQHVKLVVMDKRLFLPMEYYKDYTIRIGWFEVLTTGDTDLLLQREAYKRKTDYNPGTMALDNYEWDFRNSYYYLPQNESMPLYFYPSKGNVLKIMAPQKAAMQAYIKENRVKVSKQNDLLLVFTKYNELVAN